MSTGISEHNRPYSRPTKRPPYERWPGEDNPPRRRHTDPAKYSATVTYVRDLRDEAFDLDKRAEELGVDFVPTTERNSFDPRALTQLYRLIRKRANDIVHAHDYKTDFLSLSLCGLAGAIPMATAHGRAKFGRKDRRSRVFHSASLDGDEALLAAGRSCWVAL